MTCTAKEAVSIKIRKRAAFKNKLVTAYTAVFTALIVLFAMVAYQYIVRTGRELAMLNQAEFANKALAQVETYLAEIEDVSYRVMTNPRLLNLFNQLQQQPHRSNYFDTNILVNIDTGSLLGTINGPKARVWRISVYNQYEDYIRTGALEDKTIRSRTLAAEQVMDNMLSLLNSPNKMQLLPPSIDRWSDYYAAQYITVKRPLMNIYSQEVYGVVEIQQDITLLEKRMQFDTLQGIEICVNAENGAQVLRLANGVQQEEQAYSVTSTSEKYGWSVTLRQSGANMVQPYRPLLRMVLLGCLALLVLVVAVIVMIAQALTAPLVALKDTVSRISYASGAPAPIVGSTSSDEVRELGGAFNAMLSRISDSVKLEKNAMLLALQSQMNPHFFHNVMTVISAAGMEGRDEQVVRMCTQVCAMLRYTSSFDETGVSVGEELAHTQTYLELMKARLENYFHYEIEADEAVKRMAIPRLVLQPLAENCFEHGFSGVEPPYFIRIEAHITARGWRICVHDNGSGMDEQSKAALLEKIERYAKNLSGSYREIRIGGLGLINTALRLRYNSVRPATLHIVDNTPCGATVIIEEVGL